MDARTVFAPTRIALLILLLPVLLAAAEDVPEDGGGGRGGERSEGSDDAAVLRRRKRDLDLSGFDLKPLGAAPFDLTGGLLTRLLGVGGTGVGGRVPVGGIGAQGNGGFLNILRGLVGGLAGGVGDLLRGFVPGAGLLGGGRDGGGGGLLGGLGNLLGGRGRATGGGGGGGGNLLSNILNGGGDGLNNAIGVADGGAGIGNLIGNLVGGGAAAGGKGGGGGGGGDDGLEDIGGVLGPIGRLFGYKSGNFDKNGSRSRRRKGKSARHGLLKRPRNMHCKIFASSKSHFSPTRKMSN